MKITFLGHAGFLIETSSCLIITDPWLTSSGAFDSTWYQFPKNHHLLQPTYNILKNSQKIKFIFISHDHKDHFDKEFLTFLSELDIKLIIPKHARKELRDFACSVFKNHYIFLDHFEKIEINETTLVVFLERTSKDRDSAIGIFTESEGFLNLNDCGLFDCIPRIVDEFTKISVLTSQYSGADWFPVCYELDETTILSATLEKNRNKFEKVCRGFLLSGANSLIPSAGPPCFLDPELFYLNFLNPTPFPKQSEFIEYILHFFPDIKSKIVSPMPGDEIYIDNRSVKKVSFFSDYNSDYSDYLNDYAKSIEVNLNKGLPTGQLFNETKMYEVLRKAKMNFKEKLSIFSLNGEVKVPLYFTLNELPEVSLCVDFEQKSVYLTTPPNRSQMQYFLQTPYYLAHKVLTGKITWSDFCLNFKSSIFRNPNLYDPEIHAFIALEVEDLKQYCNDKIKLEIENNKIQINIENNTYEVDRFCPHAGADLSKGWIKEGKYLVCPRHGWMFDLHSNGECNISTKSLGVKLCKRKEEE